MNRLFLALAILGVGAGGFLSARQSTRQLTRETNANREAWLAQTQQLAAVQLEQADLTPRLRELKANLAESRPVAGNALWSALQTNRADQLPPELRERVLEELGFNWQFSPDFIVVTKQTVRDTGGWMLHRGGLSEVAATVLALTPAERDPIEAAIRQAQMDFAAWALTHVERKEPRPQDGVLAHYFLPGDPAMEGNIRTNLNAATLAALGPDRADIMQKSVRDWRLENTGVGSKGTTLLIRRAGVGDQQRLRIETDASGIGLKTSYFPESDLPAILRPVFPNGWEDVAKREGFELPVEGQKK